MGPARQRLKGKKKEQRVPVCAGWADAGPLRARERRKGERGAVGGDADMRVPHVSGRKKEERKRFAGETGKWDRGVSEHGLGWVAGLRAKEASWTCWLGFGPVGLAGIFLFKTFFKKNSSSKQIKTRSKQLQM